MAGVAKPGATVFAAPSPHPGQAGAAEGSGEWEQSLQNGPAACPGQELLLPAVGTGWWHHTPACTQLRPFSCFSFQGELKFGKELEKEGLLGDSSEFCFCLPPQQGKLCAHSPLTKRIGD